MSRTVASLVKLAGYRSWFLFALVVGAVGKSRNVVGGVAVDLAEDPNAVTLDVALLVGVAGARLLSRFRCGGHGRPLLMKSRSTRLTLIGSRTWGA